MALFPQVGAYVDAGRLQLVDVLGKGAYGLVFLARDTLTLPLSPDSPSSFPDPRLSRSAARRHVRHYAVKCMLRPQPEDALYTTVTTAHFKEMAIHSLVSDHPGVLTLRRCVQEGPFTLFITDVMDGGDLFKQITVKHRYFGRDALIRDIFLQVIDAVAYCHAQGIYHRDLKPENVLCNKAGTGVVIADFGLATMDPVSSEVGVGSAFYNSPECNAGPEYYTAENDVWSLGVMLVNLAYGRNPWAHARPTDSTFRAFLRDPNYLSRILPISAPVNEILKRVFEIDPARRMTLPQLRTAISRVERFEMTWEELEFATDETRSVSRLLQDFKRDRDAKDMAKIISQARTDADAAASANSSRPQIKLSIRPSPVPSTPASAHHVQQQLPTPPPPYHVSPPPPHPISHVRPTAPAAKVSRPAKPLRVVTSPNILRLFSRHSATRSTTSFASASTATSSATASTEPDSACSFVWSETNSTRDGDTNTMCTEQEGLPLTPVSSYSFGQDVEVPAACSGAGDAKDAACLTPVAPRPSSFWGGVLARTAGRSAKKRSLGSVASSTSGGSVYSPENENPSGEEPWASSSAAQQQAQQQQHNHHQHRRTLIRVRRN